jgi:uncharacterized protein (DUF58 family)
LWQVEALLRPQPNESVVNKKNEIPNLKQQITNKSQISKINDQNNHHRRIATLYKPWAAKDDAIGQGRILSVCLEFEILVIGICLLFVFWCLGFSGQSYFPMADKSIRLPYTLQRSRLQIRPTRYGMMFILLLLGMFVGSLNYNNNLGFLLTFLLGSMAFVSIAHAYKNIAGITIVSAGAKSVFAGEQAVFEFIVANSGAHRYGIGFGFHKARPALVDLTDGPRCRARVDIRASSRGILRPGPLLIYTDYPCGFFRVQSKLHPHLECIVYPRPAIGPVKGAAEKSNANREGCFSGPGNDDFQGLKGYLPGDPLQRISWRASSRGQGLFTKDFTGQYGSSFFLDWHALKSRDPEHKLSLLCHAVLKAHRLNVAYGLKLPGQTIAPQAGQTHKNRCLKTLALFSP